MPRHLQYIFCNQASVHFTYKHTHVPGLRAVRSEYFSASPTESSAEYEENTQSEHSVLAMCVLSIVDSKQNALAEIRAYGKEVYKQQLEHFTVISLENNT